MMGKAFEPPFSWQAVLCGVNGLTGYLRGAGKQNGTGRKCRHDQQQEQKKNAHDQKNVRVAFCKIGNAVDCGADHRSSFVDDQSVCASDAFAHLDYVLYELLWRWAKRRHPKKNKWWISTRYWHRVGNRNWVFSTENKELIRVDSTAIVRHTKIKATANPFLDEAYFQKRKFDKGMHRLTGKFKMIWKNQNGLCYHCGMPMDVTEEREIFYLSLIHI